MRAKGHYPVRALHTTVCLTKLQINGPCNPVIMGTLPSEHTGVFLLIMLDSWMMKLTRIPLTLHS